MPGTITLPQRTPLDPPTVVDCDPPTLEILERVADALREQVSTPECQAV